MKIKYSPCKTNSDTQIKYIDENTLNIDGEDYEFDKDSVEFPDIHEQTNGVILNAYRSDDLYITVRRYYSYDCTSWDNGEYNEING